MKNFDRLGWLVAVGLLGVMAGVGFQSPTVKIGTVDMRKVLDDSDFAKRQNDMLRGLQDQRRGVLEYFSTYRAATPEQAQRFRELSVKENPTAADKTQLDALKGTIQADDQRFKSLQTKPNPTADDTAALQDYNRRSQQLNALLQRWVKEFDDEVGGIYNKLREDAVDRVKTSVTEVASKQGFSVVLDSQVAPYAASDLTADALKAMNAKR